MNDRLPQRLSRRDFVALGAAAGVAGGAKAASALTESEVSFATADGRCDAFFVHPAAGRHPGVLVWPDAFGLRPSMRDMARRLAGEGYAVLVPNPFYRVSKAPQFENASGFDFADAAQRARLEPLRAPLLAPGAAERDAAAYLDFLDAQPATDRARRLGTHGYCMGGPLALRSCAVRPERVGAGASFHGGNLVTDRPDSPHRLAAKMRARVLIAIAANDDQRQPEAKDELTDAFAAAKLPAEVEVYPARHGWCVPDMPPDAGKPIHDAAQAERAWGRLLALYRAGL